MIRVKGTFSHLQANFLRNSLALTRKAIYWGNKEIEPSKLTPTSMNEHGEYLSESQKSMFENKDNSGAGKKLNFFPEVKKGSEAEIIVSSPSTCPTK